MAKKTRSAKGEIIDFDLLQIKSEMASTPKGVDVKKREDFIDRKLRRRLKKLNRPKVEATIEVEPEITEPTDTPKEK